MDLEDARRLIAALNALSYKIEGSDNEPGLIEMLEQGSLNIQEAAKTLSDSTEGIANQILKQGLADRVIRLLERDLKAALGKMADEASMSSISYVVDRSTLKISSEAEKVVNEAVDRLWQTTARKQVDQIKEHLANVQQNLDRANRKRYRVVMKNRLLESKNNELEGRVRSLTKSQRMWMLASILPIGALVAVIALTSL